MRKWRIEGYDGIEPTGFSRLVAARERELIKLLERLAAKYLSEDEIIDATLGTRTDLKVHRDKQRGMPVTLTVGSGVHYIVVEEVNLTRTKRRAAG